MKMTPFNIARVLFVIVLSFGGSDSLKNVRAILPVAVQRGGKAVLKCQFDLENNNLYTVKWYRNDREFYRFLPKERPNIKVFGPIPFNVIKGASNESCVVIEDVERDASGMYNCEVSADAPSFLTYVASGFMDVADVPDLKPSIIGIKPRYSVGKSLRGNCTLKHSRPAANLTWYINSHQVNPSYVKRYKPFEYTKSDGLLTTILGIHFLVSPQHFLNGKLKIRCTASIYNLYWQSTEKSIEEERIRGGYNSARNEGPGVVNVPPESQHVAVHPGPVDPDPPPNLRDSAHALSGAARTNGCSFAMALLLCFRTLRHLFTGELYNNR